MSRRGTRFSARLGQGFSYVLIGGGIYLLTKSDAYTGLWFIVMGWFLGQAATGAVASSRFYERLEGVTVADVMDTQPVWVPGETTVMQAQDEFFLRYRWPWFPVVESDGRLAGLVARESVESIPRASAITIRKTATVSPIVKAVAMVLPFRTMMLRMLYLSGRAMLFSAPQGFGNRQP